MVIIEVTAAGMIMIGTRDATGEKCIDVLNRRDLACAMGTRETEHRDLLGLGLFDEEPDGGR